MATTSLQMVRNVTIGHLPSVTPDSTLAMLGMVTVGPMIYQGIEVMQTGISIQKSSEA